MKTPTFPIKTLALSATALLAANCAFLSTSRAVDAGAAPTSAQDAGADLANAYFFLDPTDSSQAVMIMTLHPFIVPGDALNAGTFDTNAKFNFVVDNTGDGLPDLIFAVTFSPKVGGSTSAQTATVTLPSGVSFSAPTTPATLSATPADPTVTADPTGSGVQFFAGVTDDPFFADLVALNRYVASAGAGTPDPTVFQRGRDTFAGYNVLAIALRVPTNLIQGSVNVVSLDAEVRRGIQAPTKHRKGGFTVTKPYKRVDRVGNPLINTLLIPYADKDAYAASSTTDDISDRFLPDLTASLGTLGTNSNNAQAIFGLAVTRGDMLHLDLTLPNNGAGGGSNAGAGYPNGRRLGDDVVDTLLTLIANGAPLGDNVNANDVAFRNAFPFLAPPHQPLDAGATDDGTRN